MSELDLLADCLKDATKERDELAAALEQAQAKIERHIERWFELRDTFECSPRFDILKNKLLKEMDSFESLELAEIRKLRQTAGESDPAVAVGPNATGANALIVEDSE